VSGRSAGIAGCCRGGRLGANRSARRPGPPALLAEEPFVRSPARALAATDDADDVAQQAHNVAANLRRGQRRRQERERRAAAHERVPSSSELMEREERRGALVRAVDRRSTRRTARSPPSSPWAPGSYRSTRATSVLPAAPLTCVDAVVSCRPPPCSQTGRRVYSTLPDLSSKVDTMEGSRLLDIARDWSHWDRPPAPTVPRNARLPQELRADLALVIQGVRRCGKSTLLGQLLEHYGLDRQRSLFVNFEDPRLASALDHTTLQGLVEAFEAERGRDGTAYFFDEIQHVDGWQRWLRTALDRARDRRFVVTGSNAHLLSGELASSLTGRHLTVELFPFDLDEYRLVEPDAKLIDYLTDGGFPSPLTSPDGDRLRSAYFNDIVERDVRERVGARSSRPLRQLAQMLFESAGSELSVRRVAASLGMAVDTVSLYLDAMENAYLAFACPYFAWSERKRSVRNKKYYPVDTGLRRVVVTSAGDDRGKMLECATYVLLRRRFGEVYYWRDRGEVNFVVLRKGDPVPVQVSWDGPTERHHKALDAFYEAHPRSAEAVFVTAASYERGLPELAPDQQV
jgi:predicted AAA+ superfamily ATPase